MEPPLLELELLVMELLLDIDSLLLIGIVVFLPPRIREAACICRVGFPAICRTHLG